MDRKPSRASPEFKSVSRQNTLLEQAYLATKDGAEAKYKPNYSFIETKVAKQLTINVDKKTFGKNPFKVPPACVADQRPCNLEKRQKITKMKQSPLGSPQKTLFND